MRNDAIDALKRDVFQKRMIGIAEEMSSSLRRAAYSSIIWDMYDYSCAILTPDGQLLVQAETIPAQLGIIETACAQVSSALPRSTWEEGDIVICNDPYQGCTHTPDVVLFSPVYFDSELVAVAATIAHHVDIGGKTPCTTAPDNTEIFGEGLIFPPMKLLKRGVPVDEVFQLLAANVRHPESSLGDLRAQIAGCRTAERRVREVVRSYGPERFAALATSVLDYGEAFMRSALMELEDGTGEATILIEDEVTSPDPMEIRCVVGINRDTIRIDFSGTSEQRPHGLNCPWSSTVSLVNYAVKAILAPHTPQNGGGGRPLEIVAPLGTILNPRRPAAVGSRHFTAQAVADAVLAAMRPLVKSLRYAGSQISFASMKIGGLDTRPGKANSDGSAPYFLITDILGGGTGANSYGDGLDAVDSHGGNCAILSAEIMETVCPVRVWRTELVQSSAGAGKFRGGLGLRRVYEILADRLNVNVYLQQTHDYNRPWGSDGGGPGRSARAIVALPAGEARTLAPKTIGLTAPAGTRITLEGAGGGGLGPPEERSPELTARDRREGYVNGT